jgi:hypothetical protein
MLLIPLILAPLLLATGARAKAPSVATVAIVQKALCPFQAKAARGLLSHDLLHQLPAEEVEAVFAERARLYGRCKKLEPLEGDEWRMLTAEGAALSLELKLDASGKILDFAFGPVDLKEDSIKKIEEFGRKVFPRFSHFVEEEGKEIASHQKELPLNVGKSAQLFLLTALEKRVEEGELRLDGAVALDADFFRLAFGPLKLWPAGTKLSIDSLKSFMMIENDTAAADLLLGVVGRERVEMEAPGLKPYLSFQETHALLSELAPASLPPRAKAGELLDLAGSILPKVSEKQFQPMRPDLINTLGWFAGAESLCGALKKLSKEPSLRKTQATEGTSLRLAKRWSGAITVQVREGGVAQSTLLARSKRTGKQVCLSVTANGPEEISNLAFDDITDRFLRIIQ